MPKPNKWVEMINPKQPKPTLPNEKRQAPPSRPPKNPIVREPKIKQY